MQRGPVRKSCRCLLPRDVRRRSGCRGRCGQLLVAARVLRDHSCLQERAIVARAVAGLGEVGAEIKRRNGQPFEVVFVVDGSPDRKLPGPDGPACLGAVSVAVAAALAELRIFFRDPDRTGCRVGQHVRRDRGRPAGADGTAFGVLFGPAGRRLRRGHRLSREAQRSADQPSCIVRVLAAVQAIRDSDIPRGGVDVFGCNARFRDELLQLEESNSSLVGLIFWLGFRRREISYSRRERKHGKSAWSFGRKLNYLFDSVFSFTDLPIKLLLFFGFAGLVISVILGLMVILAKAVGEIPVPGYAATALTVLFFGGLNALGLGIVGTYAWRRLREHQGTAARNRPPAPVLRRAGGPTAIQAKRAGLVPRRSTPAAWCTRISMADFFLHPNGICESRRSDREHASGPSPTSCRAPGSAPTATFAMAFSSRTTSSSAIGSR